MRRKLGRRRIALAAALACLSWMAGGAARAAEDPLDALYSSSGVLLRSDERLFALYAAFNALGYDEAPLRRARPFASRRFSPIRQKVRAEFRRDPALAQRFEDLFARAPLPIGDYARCALSLDETFADAAGNCGQALRDLPPLLRQVRASGTWPALYAEAAAAARAELLPHLPRLDAALARLRAALDAPLWPGATAPSALLNALDGQQSLLIAAPSPESRGTLLVVGDFGEDLPFEIARLIALDALARALGTSAADGDRELDAWSRAFAAHALALDAQALARLDPQQRFAPRIAAIEARSRTSGQGIALDAFLGQAKRRQR